MPDPIFAVPRLAEIYDDLDGRRTDLDAYVAMLIAFGARSVLDIGCGTGALALRLAAAGIAVTGVDPAAASLAVAHRKPGADQVRWVEGTAAAPLPIAVEAITMTGNVAQVLLDDQAWMATLHAARAALTECGLLVFEVRDPADRAWERWTPGASRSITPTAHGPVESWVQVTEVALPFVSFRWTFRFLADGTTMTSDSTLRFRSGQEIVDSLNDTGFALDEVRQAPDRPGCELVFVAHRRDGNGNGVARAGAAHGRTPSR